MTPEIYLSPPDVRGEEREFVLDAIDSNWIAPIGPHVDAFEVELADRAGVPYAVALSSGTAALHLALLDAGVRPGDEVLVSTLTFVASANAVRYIGAVPTFVDSDHGTWNMSAELLSEVLTERRRMGTLPAAVVVVDLYGQCADYDALLPLCDGLGVPVIEDAAEALGATYRDRPAGSFGKSAVFSFNGNKIVTSSSGGMLVSSDPSVIDRARHLSTQAREPAPHYEHAELGFNYRMSNVLAALGRAQLATLDARVARRREIKTAYRDALSLLPEIGFMPDASYGTPNNWLTCITVAGTRVTPEDIRISLEAKAIESRPLWKPMHQQPSFRDCKAVLNGTADTLFSTGLCLPSGSGMTCDQQGRVIDAIRAVVERAR